MMMYRLMNLLKNICKPDFVLDGYLNRWHLLPRNSYFNVYLHQFVGDDDRWYHDHPYHSLSLLLSGEYKEYILIESHHGDETIKLATRRWHKGPKLIWRNALCMHRLEIFDAPVWTLFITGPRIREWGFDIDRKSTRLNSSHSQQSRMPSSA